MARGLALIVVAVSLLSGQAFAQVTVTSPTNKHNLSTSGPGPVKSTTMTEICIFCHTPHNSDPAAPLWNQTLSGTTYTPYSSTTMAATVGVPQGSSKLCLSCHDGTVALGSTVTSGQIVMQGLTGGKLTGPSSLGTNLGDDHPISFVPVPGPEVVNPAVGSPVKLDQNGQVQCRTCHDPHQMDIDPTTNKFLVANNSASGLCLTCHRKQYWTSNPSTHMTSTKPYAAAQGAHTGYATVATNGCESCHKPHTAAVAQRSLKAVEELTCAQCHGPSAIGRNVQAEFSKAYTHPTYSITPSVHDESESPTNPSHTLPEPSAGTPRHAECEDCHNPHASYDMAAASPKGSGKVAGVWGINRNDAVVLPGGTPPSVNEYEICFKCHADSANMPQAGGAPAPPYPVRLAPQWNKRLQFDSTSISFHPIETPGRATAVPSLIAPWTTASVMLCTDCHDNDTGPKAPTPGTGPSGPHGSSYKHLLAGRYDMDNQNTSESAAAYALCYKCHDRTIVLSSASWGGGEREHDRHVRDQSASCSICHDPHGISSAQGTTTNNAHLMNFDKRFVTPSSGGLLRFEQTSPGRGRCYLTCHGRNHNPESY